MSTSPATAALDPPGSITALSATGHTLGDLSTLPAASGLYAWWAAPEAGLVHSRRLAARCDAVTSNRR